MRVRTRFASRLAQSAATSAAALAVAAAASTLAAAPASATPAYEDALVTLALSLPTGYDLDHCYEVTPELWAQATVHCQGTDWAPEGYYSIYADSADLDVAYDDTIDDYTQVACPNGEWGGPWHHGEDPHTTAGYAACVDLYGGGQQLVWSNYDTLVLGSVGGGWTLYDQWCWWAEQDV